MSAGGIHHDCTTLLILARLDHWFTSQNTVSMKRSNFKKKMIFISVLRICKQSPSFPAHLVLVCSFQPSETWHSLAEDYDIEMVDNIQ